MSKKIKAINRLPSSNGKPKRSQKQDMVEILRRIRSVNEMISRTELSHQLYGDEWSDIDERCGYSRDISIEMYKYAYERDGVAARVVTVFPDECWANAPQVYQREDLDSSKLTKFEKQWQFLVEKKQILTKLKTLDVVSGIGHYGVMVYGVSGREGLETPAYRVDKFGEVIKSSIKERTLLYMIPLDESEVKIDSYEEDERKARYGKPKFYNVTFANPKQIGLPTGRAVKVHWTRCQHVAEGCSSSEIIGTPRMKKGWNYLHNLRKIYGGSAEMFWNGGFPGTAFTVPADIAGQVELDKEELEREIQMYYKGLKRYLALIGVEANQLKPNIATPLPHVEVELEALCISIGVPVRTFKGTEEGRLASSQDTQNLNKKVKTRNVVHTDPVVLRGSIDKLQALGVLPSVDSYNTDWADLNTVSDKDKADTVSTLVRGLAEYLKSGAMKFIPPREFLHYYQNMTIEQAEYVISEAKKAAKNNTYSWMDPTPAELQEKLAKMKPAPGAAGAKGPKQSDTRTRTKATGRRSPMGTRRKVKQV